jgi:beta-galactosidase
MLTSKVALHNNSPALFVNDETVVPVFCEGEGDFVFPFKQADIHIYKTASSMGWGGANNTSYDADEKAIEEILNRDPEALIMPYVGYLNAVSQPWVDNNPDEMTRMNNGDLGEGPSAASELFAKASENLVTQYIQHFENSPYKDNIIGYHVINGKSHEWLSWNWFARRPEGAAPTFDDYSKPMLSEFRKWLKEKYLHNIDALRDAWKDTQVTFDNAYIPTVEQRFGDYGSIFPYKTESLSVSDFYTCFAQTWAKLADRFCGAAKNAVSFSKVIGIFHGYHFLNCHTTYIQHVGHLAFSRLLQSQHIDMVFAPYAYENRGIDGCHFPQVCESSVTLHNKMCINQIDTRTAIVSPKQPQWGQSDTIEDSLNIMKRDIGVSVTHGCSYYWFDMLNHVPGPPYSSDGPHWYDHPELKSMLGKLTKVSRDALSHDCRSGAEIALFVDEESYLAQLPHRGFNSLYVTAQKQYELDKISAPFDSYMLSDLPEIQSYKLYIFLNAFAYSEEVLQNIKQQVYEKGATAIFFYAPMCYQNASLNPEKCLERIGIKLGVDRNDHRDYIHVDITEQNHPYTKGCTDYGSEIDPDDYLATTAYFPTDQNEFIFSPIFYCDDEKAQALGTIRSNKQVGLASKKWGNGTVVYSAAPMMPARMIRNIAAHAKVHLYTDQDDLVYANKNYLFITSRTDGAKQIHLPRICDVADALTEQPIGNNVKEVSVEMKKNETRVFTLA